MKRMKFWLSALVICLALAVMLPGEADAAEVVASGECGDNLTWTLTDDGTLTISGEGEMDDWELYTKVPWYTMREEISAIIIEEGVASIGGYAFHDHDGFTDIELPKSLTSIGKHAFSDCNALTGITIPSNVSTIGNYCFADCSKMTCLEILGDADVGVRAVSSCDALVELIVGNDVTMLDENLYATESNLQRISVQSGNKHFVSLNGVLFDIDMQRLIRCPMAYQAATFVIPDGVKTIGCYAFAYCETTAAVVIPNSVTTIEYYGFYNLNRKYTVYYLGTEEEWNRISIGQMNNALDSSNIHFGSNREDLAITGTCGDALTWKLTPDGVMTIEGTGAMDDYSSISDISWYAHRFGIVHLVVKDGVTSIGSRAFYWCSNMVSVKLSETVTSIGDDAFGYCTSLERIDIPDSLTSIGRYAFDQCYSLDTITLSEGLTEIGMSAFRFCTSLREIEIPGSVTKIDEFVFDDCTALERVVIGDGVTTIGRSAFSGCSALASVVIPDSVTSIGGYAFEYCSALVDVTIGNGVESIGYAVFDTCAALETVYYNGTTVEWAGITIDMQNDPLLNADIKFLDVEGIAITEGVTGALVLTWEESWRKPECYDVWRMTESGVYEWIATVTDTFFVDESVTPGTTYFYAVYAVYDDEYGVFSDVVVWFKMRRIPLGKIPD